LDAHLRDEVFISNFMHGTPGEWADAAHARLEAMWWEVAAGPIEFQAQLPEAAFTDTAPVSVDAFTDADSVDLLRVQLGEWAQDARSKVGLLDVLERLLGLRWPCGSFDRPPLAPMPALVDAALRLQEACDLWLDEANSMPGRERSHTFP
jgi:hypothetical protein